MSDAIARQQAAGALHSADDAALDAFIEDDIAGLMNSPRPESRAIGRLFAAGYRRTWIRWIEEETDPVALGNALAFLFSQQISEFACRLSDEEQAQEIATALAEGAGRMAKTTIADLFAARRLKERGDS